MSAELPGGGTASVKGGDLTIRPPAGAAEVFPLGDAAAKVVEIRPRPGDARSLILVRHGLPPVLVRLPT